MYQIRGDTNRKNDSIVEFENALDRMINNMKYKNGEVIIEKMPNLYYLKS